MGCLGFMGVGIHRGEMVYRQGSYSGFLSLLGDGAPQRLLLEAYNPP